MKYLRLLLSASVITILFASCAGNNGLQENPPANIEDAYYENGPEGITLYIPVNSIPSNKIKLQEVYFRNKIANLVRSPDKPSLYIAIFRNSKSDIIMSSDPKEEYWNKVPQKGREMDFDIKEDEAVLIYTQYSKVKYYKLTSVKERE